MLDLENIQEKFNSTVASPQWQQLLADFAPSQTVFIIANGGLWAIGTHAAADVSRLTDKNVKSMDSACLLTSLANDYGYDQLFVKWLAMRQPEDRPADEPACPVDRAGNDRMLIGLSCSGNSANIVNALEYASTNGFKTALISGQPSKRLHAVTLSEVEVPINEVCLHTKYFHTCEVLTLMLFYELIHSSGGHCPTILEEVARKEQ
ncbi:MAG: hypothetical protein EXR21_09170 [Flavobacteriaceae bacterium]|nr:hypothetical protein [Flavobacteriaceae bacterium]